VQPDPSCLRSEYLLKRVTVIPPPLVAGILHLIVPLPAMNTWQQTSCLALRLLGGIGSLYLTTGAFHIAHVAPYQLTPAYSCLQYIWPAVEAQKHVVSSWKGRHRPGWG
jgi:hypothetical protein